MVTAELIAEGKMKSIRGVDVAYRIEETGIHDLPVAFIIDDEKGSNTVYFDASGRIAHEEGGMTVKELKGLYADSLMTSLRIGQDRNSAICLISGFFD